MPQVASKNVNIGWGGQFDHLLGWRGCQKSLNIERLMQLWLWYLDFTVKWSVILDQMSLPLYYYRGLAITKSLWTEFRCCYCCCLVYV